MSSHILISEVRLQIPQMPCCVSPGLSIDSIPNMSYCPRGVHGGDTDTLSLDQLHFIRIWPIVPALSLQRQLAHIDLKHFKILY